MKPLPTDADLSSAERRRRGFEALAPRLKLILLEDYRIPWDAGESIPKSRRAAPSRPAAKNKRRPRTV